MNIRLKLTLSFVLVAVFTGASGIYYLTVLEQLQKPLLEEIPNSIEEVTSAADLDKVAQFIRYYDEVLTQSARNFAFTKDKQWELRYNDVVPELDAMIKTAIDSGDSQDALFFKQVDAANIRLIELEELAIYHVNHGHQADAIAVLESDEYWIQKAIYKEGLVNYVTKRGFDYDEAILTQSQDIKSFTENTAILLSNQQLILQILVPLVIGLGIILGIFTSRNIIKSIYHLKNVAKEIGQGNYNTKIIRFTNDELGELSDSINTMKHQIKTRSEELKAAQKDKEEFTAMISHELKTPLTPIIIWSDALKEPGLLGKLNKEQINAVDKITTSANHLTVLIADMFDVYKLDLDKLKFSLENIEVDDLMKEIFDEYDILNKNKEIDFINSSLELVTIKSDKRRLVQILKNLINNSLDFIPKEKGRIEINAEDKGRMVLFSVKDNGTGITKEKQKDLFKKFYQLDKSITREHGGTGLGLAVCKGLVEGLGGKIWVESEIGKGSTFFFDLPKKLLEKDQLSSVIHLKSH